MSSARSGPVGRTLWVLEVVAERGGASAKEIASACGLPLPTVYRLAKDLVEAGYLVHLRADQRYELGHKLHQLGISLRRQLGLTLTVTSEIQRLHEITGMAGYLAILRGPELVVAHVVDSPDCPRLQPIRFGFHEAPHATAFGKILLADLDTAERADYLAREGLRAHTARTITEQEALNAELGQVGRSGIAWEHEEFLAGWSCAAVPVRGGDSGLIGAVAVSAQAARLEATPMLIAARLRRVASRVGAAYRGSLTR